METKQKSTGNPVSEKEHALKRERSLSLSRSLALSLAHARTLSLSLSLSHARSRVDTWTTGGRTQSTHTEHAHRARTQSARTQSTHTGAARQDQEYFSPQRRTQSTHTEVENETDRSNFQSLRHIHQCPLPARNTARLPLAAPLGLLTQILKSQRPTVFTIEGHYVEDVAMLLPPPSA
jgi:hypothetical protein